MAPWQALQKSQDSSSSLGTEHLTPTGCSTSNLEATNIISQLNRSHLHEWVAAAGCLHEARVCLAWLGDDVTLSKGGESSTASCKCWGQLLAVSPLVWFAGDVSAEQHSLCLSLHIRDGRPLLPPTCCRVVYSSTKQTSEEFPVWDNSNAWAGN